MKILASQVLKTQVLIRGLLLYSCVNKCPSVGPSRTGVRTFLVSTFCI